jgi:hypothetical protein
MKNSIRTMFVGLAIVMSLVVVQVVCAGTIDPSNTITVTGTVELFHNPVGIVLSSATVDGVDMDVVSVYEIGPTWFWANQIKIPTYGDYVTIEAYELVQSEEKTLIVCSIVIDGNEILLRNDDGTPTWTQY